MEKNNSQTTLNDVLSAVNEFADKTEERFNNIDGRINNIDGRIKKMHSEMATKDFVTEKLSDLQGNLTVLMRREDTKMKTLVEILAEKKVLKIEDKKHIFALEPFPELSL